jgi:hypothetical protein
MQDCCKLVRFLSLFLPVTCAICAGLSPDDCAGIKASQGVWLRWPMVLRSVVQQLTGGVCLWVRVRGYSQTCAATAFLLLTCIER